MSETVHCTTCDEEVAVVQTVGWQANVCAQCGNELDD